MPLTTRPRPLTSWAGDRATRSEPRASKPSSSSTRKSLFTPSRRCSFRSGLERPRISSRRPATTTSRRLHGVLPSCCLRRLPPETGWSGTELAPPYIADQATPDRRLRWNLASLRSAGLLTGTLQAASLGVAVRLPGTSTPRSATRVDRDTDLKDSSLSGENGFVAEWRPAGDTWRTDKLGFDTLSKWGGPRRNARWPGTTDKTLGDDVPRFSDANNALLIPLLDVYSQQAD